MRKYAIVNSSQVTAQETATILAAGRNAVEAVLGDQLVFKWSGATPQKLIDLSVTVLDFDGLKTALGI